MATNKRNTIHEKPSSPPNTADPRHTDSAFEQEVDQPQAGVLAEMRYMITENKKWWLVPILLVLLVLGAVIFLGGTAAAPFIYTLF